MSIESIVILVSMIGSIVGVYVALSNKLASLETKVEHLEEDLDRERLDRKADSEEVKKFHHNQTKAWHELSISITELRGVLSSFKKDLKL